MANFARCLGGKRIAGVVRAMAMSPESYFRGAPDLVLFRDDFSQEDEATSLAEERASRYRQGAAPWVCDDVFCVEVKSCSDKVSANQDLWFRLLLKCKIPVHKCDVLEDLVTVSEKL